MNDTEQKIEETAVKGTAVEAAAAPEESRGRTPRGKRGRGAHGRRRPQRSERGERRSEFTQKIIGIRRVARVTKGGRRFTFSVAMVLGDKKGRVGFGLGKAADTAQAIDKATNSAKKNMIHLNLTKENSLPYDLSAKYTASVVAIRPSKGSGLVAGSAVRVVLELAGITDVTAKLHSRSKNPINNARVAMKALQQIAK